MSGPPLAQRQDAGSEVVGPPRPDTAPQQVTSAAFASARDARRALCPQGHASVTWSARTERDGRRAVTIPCAAAPCAGCPRRAPCPSGTSGRRLHLSAHDELLAARREAQTEAFGARWRARPASEAPLSELVRGHGLRRQRYRGAAKREMENLLKGAACNLKRLVGALVARGERDAAASAQTRGCVSSVAAPPLAA